MPFIFEKSAQALLSKITARTAVETTEKTVSGEVAEAFGKDVVKFAGRKPLSEIFDQTGVRTNLMDAVSDWSARHATAPGAADFKQFFSGRGGARAAAVQDFVTPIVSYRPRNPVMVPTPAEADALRAAMKAQGKAMMAAMRSMPADERKAYRAVHDLLERRPDGQRALQQLLLDGKLSLGSAGAKSRNLMQALADLALDSKLDSGIQHRRVDFVAQLTQELADPVAVSQHYKGTCAATSRGQILWSLKNPTDYTDFVHGLARPDGKAKLPNGDWVRRPADWDAGNDKSPNPFGLPGQANANGGRSIASQLTEPVFMQVGYGEQYRYSNTFDAAFANKGNTKKMVMEGGMYGEHEARLLEALFPGKEYSVYYASKEEVLESLKAVPKKYWDGNRVIASKREQLAMVKATAAIDNPIPVGVDYQLDGGHAILVTRAHRVNLPKKGDLPARAETWIEYINPWGQREVMREDAFAAVMWGVTTDGAVQGVVAS